MSTVLMGQCWPLQMPPTAKAVLMSLADQANDTGVCWPAIGTICKRTCLSERAVQSAIKWLHQAGGLMLNREQGRATTYQINPAGFNGATPDLFTAPARRAPPQQAHPRSGNTTPPHVAHPTPAAAAGDPRISRTQNHKEPSVKKEKGFDAAATELPDWLDRSLWQRWVKDRRDRKKPVTEEGAKAQLTLLDTYRTEGFTPTVVIEHSIAGGYQGLFAPSARQQQQQPNASTPPAETADDYTARIARERAAAEADRQASMNSKGARDAALARNKGKVPA